MTRQITFAPGEVYHLYNRGVEKRNIFTSKVEWQRYMMLLYLCNQDKTVDMSEYPHTFTKLPKKSNEPLIDIFAYCLMPNHFHIMAYERIDGGISKFMQKVTTAYTMYFNARHGRTGSLFGGTFKATHVQDARYMSYLMAYIHLNPIKLKEPKWKEDGIIDEDAAKVFLEQYTFSSYPDYTNTARAEQSIIHKSRVLEFFEPSYDFKSTAAEWLEYSLIQSKV